MSAPAPLPETPPAHGKDERIAVPSFHGSRQYLYELVKRLAGGA